MTLVRKNRYKTEVKGILVWSPSLTPVSKKDVVTVSKELNGFEHVGYYKSIEKERVDNGRYMVKRQTLEVKSGHGWDLYATNKSYLVNASGGVEVTFNKKEGVFYLNNFKKIVKLARLLAAQSSNTDDLYSVIDRSTGREVFLIKKAWANKKIIVR